MCSRVPLPKKDRLRPSIPLAEPLIVIKDCSVSILDLALKRVFWLLSTGQQAARDLLYLSLELTHSPPKP
jgi:hypothetical protein